MAESFDFISYFFGALNMPTFTNLFQRQMASLEGKIQAYEDVLRKLSSRFGVSDEQLMSFALTVGVNTPSSSLCTK